MAVSSIRTETDSQVQGLLDEDEFAAYEEMREEDARGPWGGGRRGGGDRNRDGNAGDSDDRSR